MGFYDDMADMVTELLRPDDEGGLGQGTVTLSRTTYAEPDPSTPWEQGEETTVTFTLNAVSRGVSAKYVDGTLILASDLQITCSTKATNEAGAVVDIVPALTDAIMIDGAAKSPKRILPIPAAGIAAAFIIFVAG